MNFELNEDQIAFADMARNFALNELEPHAAEWDQEAIFPVDVIRKAGELGFCSLYAPENVGGLGLSRLDASIIFEQLSMGCTSTTAYLTIHNMVTWMLADFGKPEVVEQWGEKLATGELLGSYCLTEPNAGSDAASLKTTAKRDGDDFVLNGSKMFISGAGSTDFLVVMARTGGEGPGGVSAFAVDAKSAGISYGRKEDKMGWNSQPTRTITFEDVRVPAINMLGNEGDGFKIAMKTLDGGRIGIASQAVGIAKGAISETYAYTSERKQFGKPIIGFQNTQFALAEAETSTEAAWLLTLQAARHKDMGLPYTKEAAMAKLNAAENAMGTTTRCLQLHGGYGYTREYPIERMMRDAKITEIYEGTNEAQKMVIAGHMRKERSA